MNFVILKGHIGQEPNVRTLENGRKVATFTMATTGRYKAQDGSWKEEPPVWHNIVAWGHLADQPIQKGNLIEVKGKITNRSYQKDDETRYITEIVATDLDIIKVMRKVSDVPPPSGLDDPKFRYNEVESKDGQGFTQPKDPIQSRTAPDASFFQSDIAPAPTTEGIPF
jgi:single-strand DNA-binding protein